MVSMNINGIRFTLRAGGLAIKDGKILLNRGIQEEYWFIPGGRIEEGEDSKTAIIREMFEEIGQEVRIVELACIIENFFNEKNTSFHEIGIYYKIEVPDAWEGSKYIKDGNSDLEYKWHDVSEIEDMVIVPVIIKKIINGSLSEKHYVYNNIMKEMH